MPKLAIIFFSLIYVICVQKKCRVLVCYYLYGILIHYKHNYKKKYVFLQVKCLILSLNVSITPFNTIQST